MLTPRGAFNWLWVMSVTGGMSAYAIASNAIAPDPARFGRDERRWARQIARGIGLEVAAYGVDRLDPAGTYVLMANHQSHVDIPALFLALPMVPGFLAKAELARIPLLGRAMRVGGHVFVDRRRHHAAVEAIRAAAEDVRRGGSIVIFPEGTRSSRREVLPFKKGGFHLARQSGVPVVPIGIRGSAAVLPKHSREIRAGRVEVHVGEPIEAERVRELSVDDLSAEVRGRIVELSGLQGDCP